MTTMRALRGVAMATALAAAAPVAAQPGTGDAGVLLRPQWVEGMAGCRIVEDVVLEEAADMAQVRRYPQCASVPEPDFSQRTVVGVSISLDCAGSARLWVHRVDAAREVRVTVHRYYGGCRAMGRGGYSWLSLPKTPPGYTVRIVKGGMLDRDCVDGGEECDLTRGWIDAVGLEPADSVP
ncbi:MAG TPA: hypothetical protein VFX98_11460 [Longimicrobiaceae bacterium]|nr:hypothetical protein [Longimicrobiaceae bacterium]